MPPLGHFSLIRFAKTCDAERATSARAATADVAGIVTALRRCHIRAQSGQAFNVATDRTILNGTAFSKPCESSAGTTTATITTAGSISRCTWSARSASCAPTCWCSSIRRCAALIGWLVAMTTRQAGHFFFEPQGLRRLNQATPRAQGRDQGRLQSAAQGRADDDLGAVAAVRSISIRPCSASSSRTRPPASSSATSALIWLVVGVGGLLFRTVHLFFIKDVQTGLVWTTKILTDPFHDIMLYYKAPLYLLRGELIDPQHAQHDDDDESCTDPTRWRTQSAQGAAASHCATGAKRCAIISRRMRAPDRLVGRRPDRVHHQPSRCIALAAATKRSATASKSASV